MALSKSTQKSGSGSPDLKEESPKYQAKLAKEELSLKIQEERAGGEKGGGEGEEKEVVDIMEPNVRNAVLTIFPNTGLRKKEQNGHWTIKQEEMGSDARENEQVDFSREDPKADGRWERRDGSEERSGWMEKSINGQSDLWTPPQRRDARLAVVKSGSLYDIRAYKGEKEPSRLFGGDDEDGFPYRILPEELSPEKAQELEAERQEVIKNQTVRKSTTVAERRKTNQTSPSYTAVLAVCFDGHSPDRESEPVDPQNIDTEQISFATARQQFLALETGNPNVLLRAKQQYEPPRRTQTMPGIGLPHKTQTMPGIGLPHGTQTMPGIGLPHGTQMMPGIGLPHGTQTMPGIGLPHRTQTMPGIGLPHGTQTMPGIGLPHGTQTMPGNGLPHGTQTMPGIGLPHGTQTMPRNGLPHGTQTMPGNGFPHGTQTMPGIGLPHGTQTMPGIGLPRGTQTMPGIGLQAPAILKEADHQQRGSHGQRELPTPRGHRPLSDDQVSSGETHPGLKVVIIDERVSRRQVGSPPDPPDGVEATEETPIEREIRLALEREEDLWKERGIPRTSSRDELVEIRTKPLLWSSSTERKEKPRISFPVQREIEQEAKREEDLQKEGRLPGTYSRGERQQLAQRRKVFEQDTASFPCRAMISEGSGQTNRATHDGERGVADQDVKRSSEAWDPGDEPLLPAAPNRPIRSPRPTSPGSGDPGEGVVMEKAHFAIPVRKLRFSFADGTQVEERKASRQAAPPRHEVFTLKTWRPRTSALIDQEIREALQRELELQEERRNAGILPKAGPHSPNTAWTPECTSPVLSPSLPGRSSALASPDRLSSRKPFSEAIFQTCLSPSMRRREKGKYAGIELSDEIDTEVVRSTKAICRRGVLAQLWEAGQIRNACSDDDDNESDSRD